MHGDPNTYASTSTVQSERSSPDNTKKCGGYNFIEMCGGNDFKSLTPC